MAPARLHFGVPLLLIAASTQAAPDGGFRLEPGPMIDDVFADSSDYRRIIDRFLVLTDAMQQTRDDFARSVQAVLAELRPTPTPTPTPTIVGKSIRASRKSCPETTIAPLFLRTFNAGQDYLRAGRELTRHFDQVREYDRLGETLGLTPDYRWKVKRVVAQYGALLTDYREMKIAFHDQMADELRFAGCDPNKLLVRAQPTAATTLRDDTWPAPEQPGAPGVPVPTPIDKGPAPQPPAATVPLRPLRHEPIDLLPNRSGTLFYVDNTRCQTGTRVTLDGRPIGDVPGATRAAFPTTPGPHDLCLIPDNTTKKCSDPGTVRRSYLHEGWTIKLQCD